jgi:superfamily II DNA or RNA helicase
VLPAGLSAGQRSEPDQERDREPRAPTLRPYQHEAIAGVEREWDGGTKRTLLVLPTGTGKTVVFAELIRRQQRDDTGRALVVAHRTELLEQARNKLRDVGVWAALEKAEHRARTERVVVASVQTLKGKRLRRFRPDEFDVVIVDEAHHSTASSYRAVLEYFTRAKVLGVTATPDRADGTALGEMFESVAYRYELRDAIRDHWLVPIVARRIFLEKVDLSAIKSRAGDLAQDELAEVMATDEAVVGVVVPLLEQAGDRPTIVFGVDVAHATAIARALCERRPGCARVAHGELGEDRRAELLEEFRAGAFQFLVNCALYTEGFDEPSVACVACARPTKSRALYTQMVGRGTRLLGATWEESLRAGKRDVLLLDFVGNAGRHRLVGPVDALAPGDVDESVRREAERMLEEDERDLDGLVDEAAAELERRREEARRGANAQYFARDVDPFFGDQLGEPYDGDWALEPATLEERTELIDLGLKRLPAGLTRGEARRILEADRRRRRLGLATYKQCALLARFGFDVKTMTKGAASARIGVLASCDWDPGRAMPRIRQIEASEMIAKNTEEHRAMNRGERT